MRLASTLDSKVVQSAERFRGKHEHFPNAQQLRSAISVIAISPPLPREDLFRRGMLSQLLCSRANGDGI